MTFSFLKFQAAVQRNWGPRIVLRPLLVADCWPYMETMQHPDIAVAMLKPWPATIDEFVENRRPELEYVQNEKGCALSIVLRDTGQWVGSCKLLQPVDRPDTSWLERGLILAPAFWGVGLGVEAYSLMHQALFTFDDVRGTRGYSRDSNARVKAMLAKAGCEFEGVVPYPRSPDFLLEQWSYSREAHARATAAGRIRVNPLKEVDSHGLGQ